MIRAYLALLVLAVSTAGAYMQGRSDGKAVCASQVARDHAVAYIAGDAAASAAAAQIARIKVQHMTIRQEVEREVRERVVYSDCSHSAEQLQRINAAITGSAAAASAAAGELSGPHPTD